MSAKGPWMEPLASATSFGSSPPLTVLRNSVRFSGTNVGRGSHSGPQPSEGWFAAASRLEAMAARWRGLPLSSSQAATSQPLSEVAGRTSPRTTSERHAERKLETTAPSSAPSQRIAALHVTVPSLSSSPCARAECTTNAPPSAPTNHSDDGLMSARFSSSVVQFSRTSTAAPGAIAT